MATTTVQPGGVAAPKSLPARFLGIITAPRATYESIVAHPKWFGMLAIGIAIISLLIGGFFYTQVGQDAMLDMVIKPEMPPEQAQAVERMAPFMGIMILAGTIVVWPLFLVIAAGILYAVFNAAMGGTATFKQVLTVVVFASPLGPIGILGALFTTPLSYYRGVMASQTNLAVLFPFLDETSFAAKFLGTIDLFWIWHIVVLSIGLSVLYKRRTQPIATAFFVLYALIAVIVAFVRRGGS